MYDRHSTQSTQQLSVQEKKEIDTKKEQTYAARYYSPFTDIYEKEDVLVIAIELPGVEKSNISVRIENDVLYVEGNVDLVTYQDLDPVYTEYNIGNYTRQFHISNKIDQKKILANFNEGVLFLKLPKIQGVQSQKISVT